MLILLILVEEFAVSDIFPQPGISSHTVMSVISFLRTSQADFKLNKQKNTEIGPA